MAMTDESFVYDDRSLEQTYLSFRVEIIRFISRLTGDVHQSEDIFQSVFIDAYAKLLGPEENRKPFTMNQSEEERKKWLYRVSYNKCMDYLSKEYRSRPFSISSSGDSLTSISLAERFEDRAQYLDEVRACLARIHPRDAELIVCHIILGYSIKELAEFQGEKPGTVKKRYTRAMQILRNLERRSKGRSS
jgi:RNA polymerase sigma-70 factor (ECF subfamily)